MDASLEKYITAARAKKVSQEHIKEALLDAGWPEEQVSKAFAKPEADLPVPPPPPPPVAHIGMWIGFLYIIFFISLYVLATSIGWVFHIAIDKMNPAPEVINAYHGDLSQTRGLLAAIIVSYPIFLTLAMILKKQLLKQPAVSNLRSRKILIYITLIGTFLIMLGHIIFTLNDFLAGTITTAALEHVAVTFLIAGSLFWYFLDEVKSDRKNA